MGSKASVNIFCCCCCCCCCCCRCWHSVPVQCPCPSMWARLALGVATGACDKYSGWGQPQLPPTDTTATTLPFTPSTEWGSERVEMGISKHCENDVPNKTIMYRIIIHTTYLYTKGACRLYPNPWGPPTKRPRIFFAWNSLNINTRFCIFCNARRVGLNSNINIYFIIKTTLQKWNKFLGIMQCALK